ncbi:MAG: hypothetical protein KDD70_17240, partial [Bdellovibrionales bacterium]|nr:hypothetical protein [Bdellovibrionales bacterium]
MALPLAATLSLLSAAGLSAQEHVSAEDIGGSVKLYARMSGPTTDRHFIHLQANPREAGGLPFSATLTKLSEGGLLELKGGLGQVARESGTLSLLTRQQMYHGVTHSNYQTVLEVDEAVATDFANRMEALEGMSDTVRSAEAQRIVGSLLDVWNRRDNPLKSSLYFGDGTKPEDWLTPNFSLPERLKTATTAEFFRYLNYGGGDGIFMANGSQLIQLEKLSLRLEDQVLGNFAGNDSTGMGVVRYGERGREVAFGSGRKVTYLHYVGELKDGIPDGEGTLTTNGGTFVGKFKDGYPHGACVLRTGDTLRQVGEFYRGEMHGKVTSYRSGVVDVEARYLHGSQAPGPFTIHRFLPASSDWYKVELRTFGSNEAPRELYRDVMRMDLTDGMFNGELVKRRIVLDAKQKVAHLILAPVDFWKKEDSADVSPSPATVPIPPSWPAVLTGSYEPSSFDPENPLTGFSGEVTFVRPTKYRVRGQWDAKQQFLSGSVRVLDATDRRKEWDGTVEHGVIRWQPDPMKSRKDGLLQDLLEPLDFLFFEGLGGLADDTVLKWINDTVEHNSDLEKFFTRVNGGKGASVSYTFEIPEDIPEVSPSKPAPELKRPSEFIADSNPERAPAGTNTLVRPRDFNAMPKRSPEYLVAPGLENAAAGYSTLVNETIKWATLFRATQMNLEIAAEVNRLSQGIPAGEVRHFYGYVQNGMFSGFTEYDPGGTLDPTHIITEQDSKVWPVIRSVRGKDLMPQLITVPHE